MSHRDPKSLRQELVRRRMSFDEASAHAQINISEALYAIHEELESQKWDCGCGRVNGIGLATCACCGRSPGE